MSQHEQTELLIAEVKRARSSLASDYIDNMLTLHAAARLSDELDIPCAAEAREQLSSACTYNSAMKTGYLLMDRFAAPLSADTEEELRGIFEDAHSSLTEGKNEYNALVLMHSALITALKNDWRCGIEMQRSINQFYTTRDSRTVSELLLSHNDEAAYRTLRQKLNGSLDERTG